MSMFHLWGLELHKGVALALGRLFAAGQPNILHVAKLREEACAAEAAEVLLQGLDSSMPVAASCCLMQKCYS